MAGRFNVEKTSEEVFEFVCGPCNVDGDVLQAKGYCSTCKDYLCDTCLKCHLRPKPSKHHVLLDEKSMPKDKNATQTKASDSCTERCTKHSGNSIEYYCQSHDFLGCTKCFISDNHRMCKGVVCIEDATADLFESPEYKTYEAKIGHFVKQLSKSSVVQQENDDKIKMYSIRAKQVITSFRQNMNEFLDRLESEMDKQASQIKEKQTSKWMSISKQVEKLDDDIKTIKRTAEQTKQSGQMCNAYIDMKRNLHELKQLEDCMVTMIEENTVSEYIFKPDASLQKVLKETKTFGMIEMNNTELIDKLTKRLEYYEIRSRDFAYDEDEDEYYEEYAAAIDSLKAGRLVDLDSLPTPPGAIESVKAGRRVDLDSLPSPPGFPTLPRQDGY